MSEMDLVDELFLAIVVMLFILYLSRLGNRVNRDPEQLTLSLNQQSHYPEIKRDDNGQMNIYVPHDVDDHNGHCIAPDDQQQANRKYKIQTFSYVPRCRCFDGFCCRPCGRTLSSPMAFCPPNERQNSVSDMGSSVSAFSASSMGNDSSVGSESVFYANRKLTPHYRSPDAGRYAMSTPKPETVVYQGALPLHKTSYTAVPPEEHISSKRNEFTLQFEENKQHQYSPLKNAPVQPVYAINTLWPRKSETSADTSSTVGNLVKQLTFKNIYHDSDASDETKPSNDDDNDGDEKEDE